MPRKRVPSYLHHKPSGQARVRIDGRDIYLGVYGSEASHKAYAREIAKWQARQDRPPEDITVSQLSVLYLQHAKNYYVQGGKPTDHLVKVRNALKYLTRMYRTLPAADFGPKKLMKLRQSFIEQGHSRTYVNDLIGVVKRAFKWAVSEELVPASVHQGLSTIGILRKGRTEAREPEPVRPVPDSLVDAIQPYVRREVWGLIQLQRATGMRPSEARLTRGCDLNMSGEIWEYRPASHKCEHHDKERVVMNPSQSDAMAARDVLLGLISDFPFAAETHRASWLAGLLTVLARRAFKGPAPLFLLDANVRGSGKSLLTDVIATITTGRGMPRLSNPSNDEEARKRITALAIAGDPLVLIDNISGTLGSAALDAALTGTVWKDRRLGSNSIVECELRAVWFATGNNVILKADTSRRVCHVRLESPLEVPEERTGFQHPNLLQHIRQNRLNLLTAG